MAVETRPALVRGRQRLDQHMRGNNLVCKHIDDAYLWKRRSATHFTGARFESHTSAEVMTGATVTWHVP